MDLTSLNDRRRGALGHQLVSVALGVVAALSLSSGCSEPMPEGAEEPTQVFDLVIEARAVSTPGDAIVVLEGQRVTLRWLTDEPTSIHLHGYDLKAALEPGIPSEWNFEAHASGRFPIEAHGFGQTAKAADAHGHSDGHAHSHGDEQVTAEPAEKTLLYFEVHPR